MQSVMLSVQRNRDTRWLKGRTRDPKARESSIKQQELKKLIKFLNANFVPGNIILTLSYLKETPDER